MSNSIALPFAIHLRKKLAFSKTIFFYALDQNDYINKKNQNCIFNKYAKFRHSPALTKELKRKPVSFCISF